MRFSIIVVMGVSGSGKTTVGKMLATKLGWQFFDGDEYHPLENIQKMSSGIPLTSADRMPWLDELRELIEELDCNGQPAVIASSALKECYREILREGSERLVYVYLKGEYEGILARLEERRGHFMEADLLESQFEELEEPAEAITVSISQPPEKIVDEILNKLDFNAPSGDTR